MRILATILLSMMMMSVSYGVPYIYVVDTTATGLNSDPAMGFLNKNHPGKPFGAVFGNGRAIIVVQDNSSIGSISLTSNAVQITGANNPALNDSRLTAYGFDKTAFLAAPSRQRKWLSALRYCWNISATASSSR